jgi:excisionase family DNA binding protein
LAEVGVFNLPVHRCGTVELGMVECIERLGPELERSRVGQAHILLQSQIEVIIETLTEAMSILDCTPQTLCRWVNEGRIPATRIGRSNKFDPAHLADWLEARQIGPDA